MNSSSINITPIHHRLLVCGIPGNFNRMALHSLHCADVPLRNCSLIRQLSENVTFWISYDNRISFSVISLRLTFFVGHRVIESSRLIINLSNQKQLGLMNSVQNKAVFY